MKNEHNHRTYVQHYRNNSKLSIHWFIDLLIHWFIDSYVYRFDQASTTWPEAPLDRFSPPSAPSVNTFLPKRKLLVSCAPCKLWSIARHGRISRVTQVSWNRSRQRPLSSTRPSFFRSKKLSVTLASPPEQELIQKSITFSIHFGSLFWSHIYFKISCVLHHLRVWCYLAMFSCRHDDCIVVSFFTITVLFTAIVYCFYFQIFFSIITSEKKLTPRFVRADQSWCWQSEGV